MKLTNKTLTWMVAGAMTFALVASVEAQTAKQRTGKVVRIKGAARYSTGNNIWQPLKTGAILKAGCVVQTAVDSFADVVVNEEASASSLAVPTAAPAKPGSPSAGGGGGAGVAATVDQDVVRILEDTVLSFDKLTATDTGADVVTETDLDLRTGAIFCAVKKQAAASRFEVKYPNGVAGIRGTMVLISAAGMISTVTGSCVAAYTDAGGNVATQVVGGGNQFNTKTGELSPIPGAAFGNMMMMGHDMAYQHHRGRGPGGRGGPPRDNTCHPVSQHRP
jgi:hypothetical protein